MKPEHIYLQTGLLLEVIGILTLVTNPDSMIGIETGFQIPAILPPNIQGIGLFIIGSALTLYGIVQMKQNS